MSTFAIVIGTRPELIKLAPVVHALRASATVHIVFTGQHRELLDNAAALFDITPDHDLRVMAPGQTTGQMLSKLLTGLEEAFAVIEPDVVIGQGDTNTAWAAAVTAYHAQIPYAHVEAGLRSHNLYGPFPEEGNRRMISTLASFHFAPTELAAAQLRREGIDPDTIWVTGNTVVDALQDVRAKLAEPSRKTEQKDRKLILLTVHRRENQGDALREIFDGVRRLAQACDDLDIAFPVHPNPAIRSIAFQEFEATPNVHLLKPLPYEHLLSLMAQSTLVLTDSGGIQEEAPCLNVPLLVLREQTERQEGVTAGAAKLVGTSAHRIFTEAMHLLHHPLERERMAHAPNPYGDGEASRRIAHTLCEAIGVMTLKSALSS